MAKMVNLWLAFLCTFAVPVRAETAVVIVDLQTSFIGDGLSSPEVRALVKANHRLMEWAEQTGHPIIVFEYANHGTTVTPIDRASSPFGRHATFIKYHDNGFARDTVLKDSPSKKKPEDLLREWGIKEIVLGGVNGSVCVCDTAKGAQAKGFTVHTAPEIVADFSGGGTIYPDNRWPAKAPGIVSHCSLAELMTCIDRPRTPVAKAKAVSPAGVEVTRPPLPHRDTMHQSAPVAGHSGD